MPVCADVVTLVWFLHQLLPFNWKVKADAGIMISASHNPCSLTALKFSAGRL